MESVPAHMQSQATQLALQDMPAQHKGCAAGLPPHNESLHKLSGSNAGQEGGHLRSPKGGPRLQPGTGLSADLLTRLEPGCAAHTMEMPQRQGACLLRCGGYSLCISCECTCRELSGSGRHLAGRSPSLHLFARQFCVSSHGYKGRLGPEVVADHPSGVGCTIKASISQPVIKQSAVRRGPDPC